MIASFRVDGVEIPCHITSISFLRWCLFLVAGGCHGIHRMPGTCNMCLCVCTMKLGLAILDQGTCIPDGSTAVPSAIYGSYL